MKKNSRFDIMRSRVMPVEPVPAINQKLRTRNSRKRLRTIERYHNKRVRTRQVSDEFSLGYGYRVFFKSINERDGRYSDSNIREPIKMLMGDYKITEGPRYIESIFLKEEADLHILILMMGKEPVTKIFEFVKKGP